MALTGADMRADARRSCRSRTGSAIEVPAGSELRLPRRDRTRDARAYIAVRGGIDVPEYLGSRSTFILGKFGGHAGRVLRRRHAALAMRTRLPYPPHGIAGRLVPRYSHEWEIGGLYGPHGAPDFFTDEDIDTILARHGRFTTTPTGPACG